LQPRVDIKEYGQVTQTASTTPSRLVNRNVRDGTKRTSIRLEPEYWEAAREICQRENMSISKLVELATKEHSDGGRTSALRTYIVTYFRTATGDKAVKFTSTEESAGDKATPPGE
jgi:predicted DNA-binding ribbon-helix-helix protein